MDSLEWWDSYDWMNSHYVKDEEGIAYALAGSTAAILEHKEDYDHSMLYEDIRQDPRGECLKLLDKLGLSRHYVDQCLEALKSDSQQGVQGFGSKMKVQLTHE